MDFDGDMELVYFPKTKSSMKEIERTFSLERHFKENGVRIKRNRALRNLPNGIELGDLFEASKIIKRVLFESTGLGEEREVDKRYLDIAKGSIIDKPDRNTFMKSVKARYDISYMKKGAANAGNIGMSLRALSDNRDEMVLANSIYHKLAQAALDGKNGEGDRDFVDYACHAIRMGTPDLNDILSEEDDTFSRDEKDMLIRKLASGRRYTGTAMLVAINHPIAHACMTGGMRSIERCTAIPPDAGPYEYIYSLVRFRRSGNQ